VHRKRDRLHRGHLTSVFAALAVTRSTKGRTSRSIKKFACTARCYGTVQIRANRHALTAEDPLLPGLRDALAQTKSQHEVCTS
jgi:hypothetical protein